MQLLPPHLRTEVPQLQVKVRSFASRHWKLEDFSPKVAMIRPRGFFEGGWLLENAELVPLAFAKESNVRFQALGAITATCVVNSDSEEETFERATRFETREIKGHMTPPKIPASYVKIWLSDLH